ncbi:MAG: hypothetical protein MUC37_04680 [Hyphomicrobium sp.]|nr:hypothetical protein [Hyphomicrobium sp.]
MTLDEIAAAKPKAGTQRVPDWALGCVRRRSITFATGVEDRQTRVFWAQAHGMTGDIRVNPSRPAVPAGTKLSSLDHETLIRLASVEGGVATTSWNEPVMSWADWIGFQPYDKYPEPGLMRRIGDCMIEFAPSGAYVEDWRFLPSAPGLLAGLRLEAEIDHAGKEHRRQGGLVIAGDHAIRALARRDELPPGTRAQDFVRTSDDPVAALERVFDCTADYAVLNAGNWTVEVSTDPRREQTSISLLGPLLDSGRRVWRIDSLEAGRRFPSSTQLAPSARSWLDREADTLLLPLEETEPRKVA